MSKHKGWVKVNLDTGAALTVYPNSWCEKKPGGNGVVYKTASGEEIRDEGEAVLLGEDEHGIKRSLTGRLSDVHKCLASAGAMTTRGHMDFYLGHDGGFGIGR